MNSAVSVRFGSPLEPSEVVMATRSALCRPAYSTTSSPTPPCSLRNSPSESVAFTSAKNLSKVARDSRIPTIIARLYGPRRTTRPIDRFKTILFVTDLAGDSKQILPVAVSIARKTKAKLEALCVFNEGDEEPADGGRTTLEKFFAEVNASDSVGEFRRLHGGVGEEVVEYAGRHKADLVAITTALGSSGDPNLTDTAEFIIRNAPCPVLCVRP